MENRVIDLFHASIEAAMQTGEPLAPVIVEASGKIVQALLNNNKILVCGNGSSGAMAQILSAKLTDRFEQERPGLPAIPLNMDANALTAIATGSNFSEVFAKPIRALVNPAIS